MEKKTLMKIVKEVYKKTNKHPFTILMDMLICYKKYQALPIDYQLFEMDQLNDFERSTILTNGKNNAYIKKFNNPKYMKYFTNKVLFYNTFNDYLNRDWLELNNKNRKQYKEFCMIHSKLYAITDENKELLDNKKNIQKLVQNKAIIEEAIELDRKLPFLDADTNYSIRMITLLGVTILSYLIVDKYVIPIDIETGTLLYSFYPESPEMDQIAVDYKFPKWRQAKEFIEKAALEVPEIGYASWDIYLGKEKIYLLNANCLPDYRIYQLPPHREGNIGLFPLFKQHEERKIEK